MKNSKKFSMNYFKQISIILTILLFVATTTQARITDYRSYGPLRTQTQNPLYLQLLALPMESAQTLNKNQWQTEVSTTFSNVFEYRLGGNTQPQFDMEIWRTVLAMQYGITDELDVRLDIPFMSTGGGFLDEFIQGYHNLFGFPNAGRDAIGNGLHSFMLTHNNQVLFNYQQTAFGMGNLALRAKYLLSEHFNWPLKVALAAYTKIPTGQNAAGLTSGYADVGASLFVEKNFKRFHLVSQLGLVYLAGHKQLNGTFLRNYFLQFGQSFEFQIIDGWSAIAQITGNTPAFKNFDANELTDPVVDLNIGFAGSFPIKNSTWDEFYYQFSFGEDVTSRGPSVDFSVMFLAGIRY